MSESSNMSSFWRLRRITRYGSFEANMFQVLLWTTCVVRTLYVWGAFSGEKAIVTFAGLVGVALFHLMFLKLNLGPVELEPLMFSSARHEPLPPFDPEKIFRPQHELLDIQKEEFNSKYGLSLSESDVKYVRQVWEDRYMQYAKNLWHSGVPSWAWFNTKAQQVLSITLFVVAFSMSWGSIELIKSSTMTDLLVWKIAKYVLYLLNPLVSVGMWLFFASATLEVLLVVHLEYTQLKRHMARILSGDLKTLDEIFADHLLIKTGMLASWVHWQLAMLYGATLSVGTFVACAFYIYTEGGFDGGLPTAYLRWCIVAVLPWCPIIGAVASVNTCNDIMIMLTPLHPTLTFIQKQQLVAYYMNNRTYFYLLPMGIVVNQLVFLGWLLSLGTMGMVSLLNYIRSVAEERVVHHVH